MMNPSFGDARAKLAWLAKHKQRLVKRPPVPKKKKMDDVCQKFKARNPDVFACQVVDETILFPNTKE